MSQANNFKTGKLITSQKKGISLLVSIFGCMLMVYTGPPLEASTSDSEQLQRTLTDFTPNTPDLDWYVQNDTVMGGQSNGFFKIESSMLVFSGNTNTNGGGFSSIRTRSAQLDLSTFEGIRLHVLGDGRRYTWHLQTDATWRGRPVSYWADFATTAQQWTTVDIAFSDFLPQFRGFRLDGPELDRNRITELGLYIYDKLDGPFEVRLAKVEAYSADSQP